MSANAPNESAASLPSTSNPTTVPLSSADDIVVGPYDVLLGRGKGMETHPGNQHFQHLIRCNVVRYMHAQHNEAKRQIVLEIIEELEAESQGRFLKPINTGAWVIVPRDEAKKKVAHALQYYQRSFRGNPQEKRRQRRAENAAAPVAAPPASSTDHGP